MPEMSLPWTSAAKVHQAEGALALRLETTVDEAARILRARAQVDERALLDVALDVLASVPAAQRLRVDEHGSDTR
jgi:hypothetical protein